MSSVNGMVRLPTSRLVAEVLPIVKQKRLSRNLLDSGDARLKHSLWELN